MKLKTIADLEHADKKDFRHLQIIPRIDSYLEDRNLHDEGRALGIFSASDIGNTTGKSLCGNYMMGCARLLFYRYVEEEPRENIDPRTRRIFNTGTKIHEQLQEYLADLVKETEGTEAFADEVSINRKTSEVAAEFELDTTTDGIYEINIVGEIEARFGLEIKSINKAGFDSLGSPKPQHVVQAIVYMACLDLPVMQLLYYCKNDSVMAEFTVPFDHDVWQAVVNKINFVREHAIEGTLPSQEVGYHCRQCRYKHICKPPKPKSASAKRSRQRFRLSGVGNG